MRINTLPPPLGPKGFGISVRTSPTPTPTPRRVSRIEDTGENGEHGAQDEGEEAKKKGHFLRNLAIAGGAAIVLWALTRNYREHHPVSTRRTETRTQYQGPQRSENYYLLRQLERQRNRTERLEKELNSLRRPQEGAQAGAQNTQPPIIYLQQPSSEAAAQPKFPPTPDIYVCDDCMQNGTATGARAVPKKHNKGILRKLLHPFSKLHIP